MDFLALGNLFMRIDIIKEVTAMSNPVTLANEDEVKEVVAKWNIKGVLCLEDETPQLIAVTLAQQLPLHALVKLNNTTKSYVTEVTKALLPGRALFCDADGIARTAAHALPENAGIWLHEKVSEQAALAVYNTIPVGCWFYFSRARALLQKQNNTFYSSIREMFEKEKLADNPIRSAQQKNWDEKIVVDEADITLYPESATIPHFDSKVFAIGDLHANAMKLIYFLRYLGVMSLRVFL